jgi:hypothetical protein
MSQNKSIARQELLDLACHQANEVLYAANAAYDAVHDLNELGAIGAIGSAGEGLEAKITSLRSLLVLIRDNFPKV